MTFTLGHVLAFALGLLVGQVGLLVWDAWVTRPPPADPMRDGDWS